MTCIVRNILKKNLIDLVKSEKYLLYRILELIFITPGLNQF